MPSIPRPTVRRHSPPVRLALLPAALFALVSLVVGAVDVAAAGPDEEYRVVRDLMAEERRVRRAALGEVTADPERHRDLVPGMVDAFFFTPKRQRGELISALEELTGERRTDSYHDWVEVVGSREELEPREGYLEWKVSLLERIDPRYSQILYPGAPSSIRLEEVVWGGVRIAGIPALVDPPTVPAAEAEAMNPDETVYGVALGGESRAYPERVLSWHEMANDVVGGDPIAISYCTLCGSAILYSTETAAGGKHLLGTSGLLYRSNKLMFDSGTLSLWSNLTGEPVAGRLAASPTRLEMLPMTRTTWKAWRAEHPETTVLDVPGLEEKYSAYDFDYRPGAADRARQGVSFPVWKRSEALPRDAEVYALRLEGTAKAWALEPLLEEGVLDDEVGGVPLVLVADEASGAVRAYRRGSHELSRGAAGELVDGEGRIWRVEEASLVPPTESGLEPLERVPGHVAFWFGWFGFYPETEVWKG